MLVSKLHCVFHFIVRISSVTAQSHQLYEQCYLVIAYNILLHPRKFSFRYCCFMNSAWLQYKEHKHSNKTMIINLNENKASAAAG